MKNIRTITGEKFVPQTEPSAVNDHLVGRLKDLLSRAESGELQSLAATGIMSDKSRVTMYSCNAEYPYVLIGACSLLHQELVMFSFEAEDEDFSDEDFEE